MFSSVKESFVYLSFKQIKRNFCCEERKENHVKNYKDIKEIRLRKLNSCSSVVRPFLIHLLSVHKNQMRLHFATEMTSACETAGITMSYTNECCSLSATGEITTCLCLDVYRTIRTIICGDCLL